MSKTTVRIYQPQDLERILSLAKELDIELANRFSKKANPDKNNKIAIVGQKENNRRFGLSFFVKYLIIGARKISVDSARVIFLLILIYQLGFFNNGVFAPAQGLLVLAETTTDTERQELEQRLREIEQEISQNTQELEQTQVKGKTLQTEIKNIDKRIQTTTLQIKASELAVTDLGYRIDDTTSGINQAMDSINDRKSALADVLRKVYEMDQQSLLEILVSKNNLAEFFDDYNGYLAIQQKTKDQLSEIHKLKLTLEDQEVKLDEEKGDMEKMLAIQTLQKGSLNQDKSQKQTVLTQTKGKEVQYQKLLEEAKKQATQLRSRLYEIAGGEKTQVTFGEALRLAQIASDATGVRAALLLAVLTQESNLGKNVGQCYVTNRDTGAGVRVSSGNYLSRVMHPTRDLPHFINIAADLGIDWTKTNVSCPMQYGWGGAMGPAQFIPATWARYKDRVASVSGKAAPSPWDIRDAFFAAALYLSDYGAAKQNYNSEWKAAMIYFSGSTNTRYRFYGDSVMRLATKYQEEIDTLASAQ